MFWPLSRSSLRSKQCLWKQQKNSFISPHTNSLIAWWRKSFEKRKIWTLIQILQDENDIVSKKGWIPLLFLGWMSSEIFKVLEIWEFSKNLWSKLMLLKDYMYESSYLISLNNRNLPHQVLLISLFWWILNCLSDFHPDNLGGAQKIYGTVSQSREIANLPAWLQYISDNLERDC